jgi:hypothetical protein
MGSSFGLYPAGGTDNMGTRRDRCVSHPGGFIAIRPFDGFMAFQLGNVVGQRAQGFRVDRDSKRYLVPRAVVAQL